MKIIEIKVDGMVCSGCEKRIENALKILSEVENVEANHASGVVRITLKDDIQEGVIREKLEDIGFKVKED